MIVWLSLFLLVIVISFILALRSMRDFQELPQKSKLEYALYLVRKSPVLSEEILQSLHRALEKGGYVASLERLFKKGQSALVVFGPKEILKGFQDSLDLLELEDYTQNLSSENTSVWEVGMNGVWEDLGTSGHHFADLPHLEPHELFMWQVLFLGKHMQVRAGVSSAASQRRKILSGALQNLSDGKFVKLPRPFSNEVLLSFYKQRSMDKQGAGGFSAKLLLKLIRIS